MSLLLVTNYLVHLWKWKTMIFLNISDCTDEALEAMGNRLLDWFQVVMTDTQKRKLNRRNRNSQGKRKTVLFYDLTKNCVNPTSCKILKIMGQIKVLRVSILPLFTKLWAKQKEGIIVLSISHKFSGRFTT